MYDKLLKLENEQKRALETIQEEVKANGGYVSIMRLIRDSIYIFTNYYRNQAVEKYGNIYKKYSKNKR